MGKKLIALLGEFKPEFPPHLATNAAIEHSCSVLGCDIRAVWIATQEINKSLWEKFSAIWVVPGSPYNNMENVLTAIRYARENRIPCLGTCGGFQHMVLEYARNVLGFEDAQHAEYDPYASDLFISRLKCSLSGRTMKLRLVEGSKVSRIYGASETVENYYCDFSINPMRAELFRNGALRVSGWDGDGEIRAIEDSAHPFFIGTLYVPQSRSSSEQPHPLITAFVDCVARM